MQYVASVLCEAGCRRQRGWEAGLGGGANAQPVKEGDAEGGAAVSGHTASRCPPVVYRCIVGSHKAVSVCFMFFFFIKPVDQPFSSFSLVTECILPPAARKQAAPERKTGKTSACV